MSRSEKAQARLLTVPTDFTWDELVLVLKRLGYELRKSDGSRRSFVNPKTEHKISLHEPHPKKVVKKYALELVIEALRNEGLL